MKVIALLFLIGFAAMAGSFVWGMYLLHPVVGVFCLGLLVAAGAGAILGRSDA